MIFYDFKCDKCDIIWEKDYPRMPKSAKKIRCPKCKKWAERHYSASNCPTVKIAGTRHKVSQSDVNRTYQEMIDDSKNNLKLENQHKNSPYKSYKPNIPAMVAAGMAKPCSTKRLSEKAEAARQLTGMAHEKAGKSVKEFRRTNDT